MIDREYGYIESKTGFRRMTATYNCQNGELLYELFDDNFADNAMSRHIISEIEQVVIGKNDSFKWAGNICYVENYRDTTCIYDSYAEGDEYENTKCQLPTSDFLFLIKEWIEKKKEFKEHR